MKSTITLTPELAKAAGLVAGEDFELCIKGTCTSSDENGASGDVTEAEPDDQEDANETAGEEEAAPAKEGSPVDKMLQEEGGEGKD